MEVVSRLQYANFNGVDNYHFASDLNALCHLVELSRREAISLIKRELGRLLLHIAPQKFKLDVSFGFDDPATTGQVMAILSMLYPIWSYDISLHPDFENKVMSGHIYMRGRIRVFTLIRIAWRVYFNKNLKKVLVMLQKGGTKHG